MLGPDVPLTTREVARALGVSAATVKRWAETGVLRSVRTPGGHRRFFRADLEQVRGRPEIVAAAPAPVDAWIERLLVRNPPLAIDAALLDERVRLGSWWAVAMWMGAVLDELGRRWEEGSLGVAEEHVAATRLGRALSRTCEHLPIRSGAPVAVLAAVEGEEHVLGMALAELCLREAGWGTISAGANTPTVELELATARYLPRVLALSASPCARPEILADLPERIRSASGGHTALVLGGRGGWPERPAFGRVLRTFAELPAWIAGFEATGGRGR